MAMPAALTTALNNAWDAAAASPEKQATVLVTIPQGIVKVHIVRDGNEVRIRVRRKVTT